MISDLAFPFAWLAAFREQGSVFYGRSHGDTLAYFEHARYPVAFHYPAVGMSRNRRNVMSEETVRANTVSSSFPAKPTSCARTMSRSRLSRNGVNDVVVE